MSKHGKQIVEVEPTPHFERPKRPDAYPVMSFGVELSEKQRQHIVQINKGVELARRRSEKSHALEEQERQQILVARKQLRNN